MKSIAAGAAVLALWAGSARAEDPLAWFDGTWCTPPGAEQTCERWGAPMGGVKAGTSQTVKDGKSVVIELVTIDLNGPKAQVQVFMNGRPPVPFTETARTAESMTFENGAHDYPQRIRYWRDGALLRAEISKLDGSRPESWAYTQEK
jgi:hypothetical protein